MSLFGLAGAGLSILGQMDDYAMSSAKAKYKSKCKLIIIKWHVYPTL